MRLPLFAAFAVLLATPALGQEQVERPACISAANPLGFLFGNCLTGEETYKLEEEETLRRIKNGTATQFDYANYRLLQFLNAPGDDFDN